MGGICPLPGFESRQCHSLVPWLRATCFTSLSLCFFLNTMRLITPSSPYCCAEQLFNTYKALSQCLAVNKYTLLCLFFPVYHCLTEFRSLLSRCFNFLLCQINSYLANFSTQLDWHLFGKPSCSSRLRSVPLLCSANKFIAFVKYCNCLFTCHSPPVNILSYVLPVCFIQHQMPRSWWNAWHIGARRWSVDIYWTNKYMNGFSDA